MVDLGTYRRARCAHCAKPMSGVEKLGVSPARYCDYPCGAAAQPEHTIKGIRKGEDNHA